MFCITVEFKQVIFKIKFVNLKTDLAFLKFFQDRNLKPQSIFLIGSIIGPNNFV